VIPQSHDVSSVLKLSRRHPLSYTNKPAYLFALSTDGYR
jgi:hypothetical protein